MNIPLIRQVPARQHTSRAREVRQPEGGRQSADMTSGTTPATARNDRRQAWRRAGEGAVCIGALTIGLCCRRRYRGVRRPPGNGPRTRASRAIGADSNPEPLQTGATGRPPGMYQRVDVGGSTTPSYAGVDAAARAGAGSAAADYAPRRRSTRSWSPPRCTHRSIAAKAVLHRRKRSWSSTHMASERSQARLTTPPPGGRRCGTLEKRFAGCPR